MLLVHLQIYNDFCYTSSRVLLYAQCYDTNMYWRVSVELSCVAVYVEVVASFGKWLHMRTEAGGTDAAHGALYRLSRRRGKKLPHLSRPC